MGKHAFSFCVRGSRTGVEITEALHASVGCACGAHKVSAQKKTLRNKYDRERSRQQELSPVCFSEFLLSSRHKYFFSRVVLFKLLAIQEEGDKIVCPVGNLLQAVIHRNA